MKVDKAPIIEEITNGFFLFIYDFHLINSRKTVFIGMNKSACIKTCENLKSPYANLF